MTARWIAEIPILSITTVALHGMVLEWLDMSHTGTIDVVRYRVYRQEDNGNWHLLGYSSTLTYTDTTAGSRGIYYHYKIACEYLSGVTSAYSNIVTGWVDPVSYDVPVLVLTTEEIANMVLDWTEMSEGGEFPVDQYTLYRREDGGAWSVIATPATNHYVDATADQNLVLYEWYVVANYTLGNDSPDSNIVQGIISLPDYVYLLGGDGKMHVLDAQAPTAPTFVRSQDFSAQFGQIIDADRLLIDDIHLYVGCGAVGFHHTHVFNISNGTLAFGYTLAPAENYTSSILLRRNRTAILTLGNNVDTSISEDITGPSASVNRNWQYSGSFLGPKHEDSACYDPDEKRSHTCAGGDYSYALRWRNLQVADNDLISECATQLNPISGQNYSDEVRAFVQQRTGQKSLYWLLLNSGWVSFVMPALYGATQFSSFSFPDFNTSSWCSRGYLRGNYFFQCMKQAGANRYAVEIIDLTDPANPARLTGLGGLNTAAMDILFFDDGATKYAYVLRPTGKTILIYNITDVTNPVLVDTVVISQLSTNMHLISKANNISQYDGGNGFMPDIPS
jgi:hypothetical protein